VGREESGRGGSGRDLVLLCLGQKLGEKGNMEPSKMDLLASLCGLLTARICLRCLYVQQCYEQCRKNNGRRSFSDMTEISQERKK